METTNKGRAFTKNGRAIPKGSSIKGSIKGSSINYSAPSAIEIAQVREQVDGLLEVIESDSYSQSNETFDRATTDYMNRGNDPAEKAPIIDLFHYFLLFDFSQEWSLGAVRELAERALPSHVQAQAQLPVCSQALALSAQALYASVQLRERGLRKLAQLLCFVNDPGRPSALSQRFSRFADPTVEIRMRLLSYSPGMLPNALRELDQKGWWPDYLPAPLVEQPPVIDIDQLAGIPAHERMGFNLEDARAWLDFLEDQLGPHGYSIRALPLGGRYDDRGYAIELGHGEMSCFVRFASGSQWDLILDAERVTGSLGGLDFLAYLHAALGGSAMQEKELVAS